MVNVLTRYNRCSLRSLQDPFSLADQLRGFEAVHFRHDEVHEDL